MQLEVYLDQVANGSVALDAALLNAAVESFKQGINRKFSEDLFKGFKLRMSVVGKPICQLMMDKAGAPKLEDEYNHPVKMIYGHSIEAFFMLVIRAAGLNVIDEQKEVVLPIKHDTGEVDVIGTYDLDVDGAIWDIKSASSVSFNTKFTSYDNLKHNDDFGYVTQLYGYAKAAGKKPGGWFIVDKESGRVRVLACPDNYEQEMDEAITKIQTNVNLLLNSKEFRRAYEDKPEMHKKKPTGNRVLGSPCTYCQFKYSCWPNLRYLPNRTSEANNPEYRYYTEIAPVVHEVNFGQGA